MLIENLEDVVYTFLPEKLKKEPLFDFLPHIEFVTDHKIMRTWESYFKGIKVPYAITDSGISKKLWKIKKV